MLDLPVLRSAAPTFISALSKGSVRQLSSFQPRLNSNGSLGSRAGRQAQAEEFVVNARQSLEEVSAKIMPSLAGVGAAGQETKTATPKVAVGYKPPTPPSGIPLSKILSNTFPLPLSEAYEQWTDRTNLKEAEEGVLSFLPFFPEPDATRSARSLQVDVGGGNWVNEFEITQHAHVAGDSPNDLVILHGYGAGLAFFYRNLDAISAVPGWNVHALDLLGYGRSSRPKFVVKAKDPYDKIRETENFFIDALEAWRKAKGIEQFTFVAHSMGAYFASAYSMKYPGHIKKLVLVSPAGVARSAISITAQRRKAEGKHDDSPPLKMKIPTWFNFLWERHVSPFSLVRYTGPMGPRFVSGWTARRFANLPEDEAKALHRYTYTIFNAPGSGEYALNYLLAPGANARWPLAERAKDITCKTEWVYGQNDWMDVSGGIEACTNIRQAHGAPAPPLHLVPDAGHHIFLDNPEAFNKLVISVMSEVEKSS